MKLFVGLGNPGPEYSGHRHNVGFMALDRIAVAHEFGPWKKKFRALVADGELGGERILLVKPQTYMNDSGESVGEAARFLKVDEGDVIVFYDEIDLAPGKLKVKTGGGNAGHNGLRSISAHLGNDYVRVRIGIGHPGAKELVARWVLSDFAKADAIWLAPLIDAIAKAAARLAKGDDARFMSDVQKATAGSVADQEKGKSSSEPPAASPAKAAARHPGGEGQAKRQSALAENLKKWLAGRKPRE